MAVSTLDDSYHFFDKQKHENASQYPHSHAGLVAVVVAVFRRVRLVRTAVLVIVAMVVAVMMVRGQRVGNEVQERVAQQSAGREAQQHLQEGLLLVFVLDGNEEEHEKRQHADGHGGAERLDPESGVGRHGRHVGRAVMVMVFVVVVVVVVVVVPVVMVPVAQAQFRQAEEHGREQQRPADVLAPLFGRRRHGGYRACGEQDWRRFPAVVVGGSRLRYNRTSRHVRLVVMSREQYDCGRTDDGDKPGERRVTAKFLIVSSAAYETTCAAGGVTAGGRVISDNGVVRRAIARSSPCAAAAPAWN